MTLQISFFFSPEEKQTFERLHEINPLRKTIDIFFSQLVDFDWCELVNLAIILIFLHQMLTSQYIWSTAFVTVWSPWLRAVCSALNFQVSRYYFFKLCKFIYSQVFFLLLDPSVQRIWYQNQRTCPGTKKTFNRSNVRFAGWERKKSMYNIYEALEVSTFLLW